MPSLFIAIAFLIAKPSSFEVCAGSIATITRPGVSLSNATPGFSIVTVAPTLCRKTISVNPADNPPWLKSWAAAKNELPSRSSSIRRISRCKSASGDCPTRWLCRKAHSLPARSSCVSPSKYRSNPAVVKLIGVRVRTS